MNKLLGLFVLTLLLASCGQKADDISNEKASNNSPVSVENTKTEEVAKVNTGVLESTTQTGEVVANSGTIKTYQNEKLGFEFQYGSDYKITEDTNSSFSVRKDGDLEEEKNGDGVCLSCSLYFVSIPKFLGNTEIKTIEEWLELQKKIGMKYNETTIDGKLTYNYKDTQNGRDNYLIFIKNGDTYDRYDFSLKLNDSNANKILSTLKFIEKNQK